MYQIMGKKGYLLYILLLLCGVGYSQDAVFSQYYAAPIKTNPAFTGLTHLPLINVNYRNQWPGFHKAYVTYNVGYSQFFEHAHSGVGFYAQADNAGDGLFVTSEFKGLYAYQLEPTKDIYLKLGVEVGVISNSVGWEKLLFSDQIDPRYGAGGTTSEEIASHTKTFLDIGSGILLYNKKFYAGFAMSHLNTPNNQLLDVSQNLYEGLPIRFNVQVGGQLSLSRHTASADKFYLAPNIGWFKQADFHQLDFDVFLGFGRFFAGLGYRHAQSNTDAAKVSVGLAEGIFKIGYSYDYTLSELTNASAGGHEISIILNFDQSENAKRKRSNAKYRDCFGLFR